MMIDGHTGPPEQSRSRILPRLREDGLLFLFFLLACAQGYHVGVGDLSLYFPFVMHLHDRGIFGDDLLMQSLGSYSAPLWHAAAWLLNFTGAERLFLALFLVQTAVITAGARFFYRQLFGRDDGWVLFLLMLVLERSSGAMNTFGLNPFGYFQPGGLAFGMVLIMYGLLDKGYWKTAGVIAGTMFLYHPFTALWACLLFFLRAMVGTGEQVPFRKKAAGAALLALCASPYVIPFLHAALAHPQQPLARDLWTALARMRLSHAFFLSQWVPDRFIHFTLVSAGILLFRRHPAFRRTLPFLIATAAAFLTIAFAEIAASRFLLQLNLARCTYLLFVLFFAFTAWRIADNNAGAAPVKTSFWALLSLLLMIYPFVEHHHGLAAMSMVVVSLIAAAMTLVFKARRPHFFIIGAGFLLIMAASGVKLYDRYNNSGVLFNTVVTGPWYDLQLWVRSHVPRGERLMTPVYIEGFRSGSLHPIYGDYKDGGSHLFCPRTVTEWWKRMLTVGLTLHMKEGDFPRAYHERAIGAALSSGIGYVVFDKRYAVCAGAVLYENSRFGVAAPSDSAKLVLRQ
ncbi:MAG: hypothetical protein JW699_05550 [Chitinispirillaceae bacterium]|nr:hypothetical protein [Chitinispirillaceae bacterium]